jgi:WD40 repeat protein
VDRDRPEGVLHAKAHGDTELTCFAFSSDGKSSALGIDSTVRVASPGRKETVALDGHSKRVFALAFSADAKSLVRAYPNNPMQR